MWSTEAAKCTHLQPASLASRVCASPALSLLPSRLWTTTVTGTQSGGRFAKKVKEASALPLAAGSSHCLPALTALLLFCSQPVWAMRWNTCEGARMDVDVDVALLMSLVRSVLRSQIMLCLFVSNRLWISKAPGTTQSGPPGGLRVDQE